MLNIGGQLNDDSYRYKMPSLKSKKEGKGNGTKTALMNLPDISKSLNIDPIYPIKFLGIELCTQSSYNKKTERCIINGHHSTDSLQKLLYTFIEKFILCDRCSLPETTMHVDKKREKVVKKCAACGIKTRIDPKHKLTTFICKKPPVYKKTALKGKKTSKQTEPIKKEIPIETPSKDLEDSEPIDLDLQTDSTLPKEGEPPTNSNALLGIEKRKTTSILYDLLRDESSVAELLDEVGRMELASPVGKVMGRFLVAQSVIAALFSEMDEKAILKEIERQKGFLVALMEKDERNQSNFLEGLEEYLGMKRPELLDFSPMILERLYDCEVLGEELILEWYEREESSDKVRKSCKVFVDWLKEAEEEESDG